MENILQKTEFTLPARFGNTGVHISRIVPSISNGIHVLLMHGVHSTANFSPRNKFSHLANILAASGFTPWLCETSRIASLRDKVTDKLAWLLESFDGKSCRDEIDDCKTALSELIKSAPQKIWLWGFSLGGIMALAIASETEAPIDKIILSGTGINATSERGIDMMSLPILSTLREAVSEKILEKIRVPRVISFHGTDDGIFSSAACRDLLDAINIPALCKRFVEFEGVDHSFKKRFGHNDISIMDEMVSFLKADYAQAV